ncbi:DUF3618 domain-containing protein [Actinomyces culturomici]|uniref:DUF3618 domain-containing protein n=1 Tax=Actinomyces culturomici TaxID=1926276 RepID=UPI000E1FD9BF|nr:DUF3618 domain-containing protein [Actinomyces culturomici]
MSEQSTPSDRTEEQILAELAETRARMTATVDELFGRVQPDYLVGQAKESAKTKATEFKALAAQTVQDAKDGDSEALKRVGYVAAGVAAVAALVVLRIVRGRR